MTRYLPRRAGALAALALLCSLTLPPGATRAATPVSTLKYLDGDPVSVLTRGPAAFAFSSSSTVNHIPAINDPVTMGTLGAVAFVARFTDTSGPRVGIFDGTGILVDDLTVAADFDGNPLPATYRTFQPPALNQGGQVAFHTRLSTDGGTWSALYTNLGGTLRQMARVNHPAPGLPNEFLGSLTQFALTDDAIFFTAKLKLSANVKAFNDEALWMWKPTLLAPMLVLRKGFPFAVSRFQALVPALYSVGHGRSTSGNFVAAEWAIIPTFHEVLLCDTTTAGANSAGAYSYLLPGLVPPGLGSLGLITGTTLGLPAVNSSGNIAVKTPLVSSNGLTEAIFTGNLSSSAVYSELVIGTPTPAISALPPSVPYPSGSKFTVVSQPASNADGDVAAIARLDLFSANRGSLLYQPKGGALISVLRLGDPAPNLPTAQASLGNFAAFSSFALPDGAGPMLRANTTKPGMQGLWARDTAGNVQVLVHTGVHGTGSSVPSQSPTKTVSAFFVLADVPGSRDQRRSFNAHQQVAYLARFSDGTRGIVTVQY